MDGHPILGCDTGLLISDIADQELCLTSGELEGEVSLGISRGTLLGTYDEDGGHGETLTILVKYFSSDCLSCTLSEELTRGAEE